MSLALATTITLGAGPAGAVDLQPGEILIADAGAFGGSGGVIAVDPVTGAQTTVSSGGNFFGLYGVVVEPSGTLLASDPNKATIFRVDPSDGSQTVLTSGGNLIYPVGLALDRDGNLLVADAGNQSGPPSGGVIRVDTTSGVQTPVSLGGNFHNAHGIAVELNGTILVTDYNSVMLVKVDPVTGAQAVLSSGGMFVHPEGVAVERGGSIVVADSDSFGGTCPGLGCGGVIRVDPITGSQTRVASLGTFSDPFGIAVQIDGKILVADHEGNGGSCGGGGCGAVIQVNPAIPDDGLGTNQRIISSLGDFWDPFGIALMPFPVPATSKQGILLAMGLAGIFLLIGRRRRSGRP